MSDYSDAKTNEINLQYLNLKSRRTNNERDFANFARGSLI